MVPTCLYLSRHAEGPVCRRDVLFPFLFPGVCHVQTTRIYSG